MSAAKPLRCPCPSCDRGPRDTAFSIDEGGGWCFRCQYWFLRCQCRDCAKPIVLVESVSDGAVAVDAETFQPGQVPSIDARHRCGEVSTEHRQRPPAMPARTTPRPAPLDWSSLADSIWRQTQGLSGTLGQTYLEHRGCALPPRESAVRYLPPDGRHPPRLCSAITDIHTGKPISLHFTDLAADGRGKAGGERDKKYLGAHRKSGGVIRIWPDEAVTDGLALAEGIESALAAARLYSPIWATADAGNLARFPVLGGIESLVIYADHDHAGIDGAQECAERWRHAGREVLVLTPTTAGHDAADVRMVAAT